MIQRVLEADEFPDEGIVAAVGLISLMGHQLIEIQFRADIVFQGVSNQPRLYEASSCHADEASGQGVAVFTIVPQAFPYAFCARQAINQLYLALIHKVSLGRGAGSQKLSTISRKVLGSRDG